ncbi:hypothetical protein [Azospirillum soli]|uniref:hypothetical protein n=1 Tax=Azospirillum soli TaxID=1304799 RepID=UPI001AEAF385|nr:hypothetical protein [Azospirillum soli]MBP2312766.1 hypothetical protein [Azospirillum soli]
MHDDFPFSSWSLNASQDMRAIRRQAEEMRAQYLKTLFRRLFSAGAGHSRPTGGRLSGMGA